MANSSSYCVIRKKKSNGCPTSFFFFTVLQVITRGITSNTIGITRITGGVTSNTPGIKRYYSNNYSGRVQVLQGVIHPSVFSNMLFDDSNFGHLPESSVLTKRRPRALLLHPTHPSRFFSFFFCFPRTATSLKEVDLGLQSGGRKISVRDVQRVSLNSAQNSYKPITGSCFLLI